MKLRETLVELVGQLEAARVGFAVVGGLAASARGEAGFTRDIDIVVAVSNDAGAEAVVFQLTQRGFRVLATVEQDATHRRATARLQHGSGVVCDLIFATCGIEREIVDGAEPLKLFDTPIRTAAVEAMVAMKVLSATDRRPRDLGDIQAMLQAHPDLDEAEVRRLLNAIVERGFARGQDLLEKWAQIRVRLRY